MWSDRSLALQSNHVSNPLSAAEAVSDLDRESAPFVDEDAFKQEIIKDILCQIDYRAAQRKNVVDLGYEHMAEEMRRLSTRALVAWYEAFLYIRSELMFSGYELNGFKVLDRPYDAIRKLMETDPNFDIRQYIF